MYGQSKRHKTSCAMMGMRRDLEITMEEGEHHSYATIIFGAR